MSYYHEGCGGIIVNFSSFTEKEDIETPVCTKCGAMGKSLRTRISGVKKLRGDEMETKDLFKSKNHLKIPRDLQGRFCGEHNSFWTAHEDHKCELCNAPIVDPKAEHCLRKKCWNGGKCGFVRRSFC